jgi:hypothetical protein
MMSWFCLYPKDICHLASGRENLTYEREIHSTHVLSISASSVRYFANFVSLGVYLSASAVFKYLHFAKIYVSIDVRCMPFYYSYWAFSGLYYGRNAVEQLEFAAVQISQLF